VLAQSFSDLLQQLEPALTRHLDAMGTPALGLALPWIATAFAGVLRVGEVLLLWDRVIGFDSLLPLPLLAVAVLAWRSSLLLQCTKAEHVRALLSDLSELRVVPLLQAVLFLSAASEL